MNELINQMFELENVVITGDVKPLVQRENLQLTLNIQREENREHGGENTKTIRLSEKDYCMIESIQRNRNCRTSQKRLVTFCMSTARRKKITVDLESVI